MDSFSYTFPFSTCEVASTYYSVTFQPFSFLCNIFIISMLVGLRQRTLLPPVRQCLASYILFELAHAVNHVNHIEDSYLPTVVQHYLAMGAIVCTHRALLCLSDKKTSSLLFMLSIVGGLIDMIILFMVGGVWPIISGICAFVGVLFVNLPYLPSKVRNDLASVVAPVFFTILAFVNEATNCQAMLNVYKFPYHILVEFIGAWFFWNLSAFFINYEAYQIKTIETILNSKKSS